MSNRDVQLANQLDMDSLSNSIDTLSQNVDNRNKIISPIALSNSAAGHNGIYRGKDLTNIYTIDQICQMVSDGTFADLYIGDYITVTIPSVSYTQNYSTYTTSSQEVDILFADFNTFLYKGSVPLTKNHITCVLRTSFTTQHRLYESSNNYACNGYKGSELHNTTLPLYATALNKVLNNHIVSHYRYLSSRCVYQSYVSECTWSSTNLCLMNEVQLLGKQINGGNYSSYQTGDGNTQFSLFRLVGTNAIDTNGYIALNSLSSYQTFLGYSNGYYRFFSYDCSNTQNILPYFLIG